MSRICLKTLACVTFACLIVAASNYGQPPAGAVEPAPDTTLKDLQNLDELRALFNKDKDTPRLILLLSPTWPICVAGARWVQNEILAEHPSPKLRVYAVWFNMYHGDERSKWPSGLLTDPRVVHFWDEQKVVGTWFGKHPDYTSLSNGQVLWDAFLLYGGESNWGDKPSHLISTGRTIVAKREELRKSLPPLLK